MNSNEPRFSDLKGRDLRPWLDLPVTRLLLAHLLSERDAAKNAIADFIFNNQVEEARVTSGGLRVLETLLVLLTPPEAPVPDVEEEFVDPGAIPPPPTGAQR